MILCLKSLLNFSFRIPLLKVIRGQSIFSWDPVYGTNEDLPLLFLLLRYSFRSSTPAQQLLSLSPPSNVGVCDTLWVDKSTTRYESVSMDRQLCREIVSTEFLGERESPTFRDCRSLELVSFSNDFLLIPSNRN